MDGNNSNQLYGAQRDSGYFSGSQSWKKSLNNNTGNGAEIFSSKMPLSDLAHMKDEEIEQQFNSLDPGRLYPATFALREEFLSKNRYPPADFPHCVPYDHNCVILLSEENDNEEKGYINASRISSFTSSRRYIAAQGPLENTVEDFWTMIWENKVSNIVMLTNVSEHNKIICHQYWPSSGALTLSRFCISHVKEETVDGYTVRTLKLEKMSSSETREITHIHYGWPDFGVPTDHSAIFSMINRLKKISEDEGPIVVHCSAGVGRTGTFLTLDQLCSNLGNTDEIDILACVYNLRQQRARAVQNMLQYKYLYDFMRYVSNL